jgi:transcriptional regulator with XRE-family HTH domain
MKELRERAGLSIDEAGRKLGVGIDTVHDWERGDVIPSELSAPRISQIYKVSADEWLEALYRQESLK